MALDGGGKTRKVPLYCNQCVVGPDLFMVEVEDGIAIPPAPNWYGSALADWGVGCNDIYAYAARNAELGIGRKWSHFGSTCKDSGNAAWTC